MPASHACYAMPSREKHLERRMFSLQKELQILVKNTGGMLVGNPIEESNEELRRALLG